MKTKSCRTMSCFALLFAMTFPFFTGIPSAQAFLDKKTAAVGQTAPDFNLADTTGTFHRLSDYRGKNVVLVFWSAQCPFIVRYEDRLQDFVRQYADQNVVILGIDANSTESLEDIRKAAAERGVNYPILLDSANAVADQYGAVTTPHLFILDAAGTLVYEGAFDNQGWSEDNPVTEAYARDVVEALLNQQEVPYTQSKTFGCTIKRAIA